MPARKCKVCLKGKPLASFELTPSGYRRRTCAYCRVVAKRRANPRKKRDQTRAYRNSSPIQHILFDCRGSDKKHGREGNDLDRQFVESLLMAGCLYCGATDIKMTVDRIDNSLAHIKANVNPACIRCNLIRGSMPYKAWVHLVPSVREATQLGLFGEWRSRPLPKT
jgi:hypothetical protein